MDATLSTARWRDREGERFRRRFRQARNASGVVLWLKRRKKLVNFRRDPINQRLSAHLQGPCYLLLEFRGIRAENITNEYKFDHTGQPRLAGVGDVLDLQPREVCDIRATRCLFEALS